MPDDYRRHLPHRQPDAAIIFVTFRTVRSLPRQTLNAIAERRRAIESNYKSGTILPQQYIREHKRLFAAYDKALDSAANKINDPSCLLHKTEHATALVKCIEKGHNLRRFILHRYCVMPNHVHLLIEPLTKVVPTDMELAPMFPSATQALLALKHKEPDNPDLQFIPLSKIMKAMKGAAAHSINALSGRSGELFQQESFDHFVRDYDEYLRIIKYIDENPVAAGLCRNCRDWRWGSAGIRDHADCPDI